MRIYGAAVLTRLPPDTRTALDAVCRDQGVRISEFIREAIHIRLETAGAELPDAVQRRRVPISCPRRTRRAA